jgi:hypothetical protein
MAVLFLMVSLGHSYHRVLMFPLPVVITQCSITNCIAYTIVPTIWLRIQPQFTLSAAPRSRQATQLYSQIHSSFCDEYFWWSVKSEKNAHAWCNGCLDSCGKINNIANWLRHAVLHTTLTVALFGFKMHWVLTVNVILCTFLRKAGFLLCPLLKDTHKWLTALLAYFFYRIHPY